MKAALAAALLLAVNTVAAVVSIKEGLPAEFGGRFLGGLALDGNPTNVLGDFLGWRGTAMAAPLPLLSVIAVLALAAAARWKAAYAGLALVGALVLVGYLGEPLTWEALSGSTGAAKTGLTTAGLVAATATAWFGFADWRDARERVPAGLGVTT